MSISLTSPVTGGPQTGLTSPTYTVVSDSAEASGKQYAVTAMGGTQTGVTAHSVGSPFTISFWRPKVSRMMGRINANGILTANPKNRYAVIVRKGVTPLAGQAVELMVVSVTIDCPAGAETYDPANVRACLSLAAGSLWQQSAGEGDLVVNGVL